MSKKNSQKIINDVIEESWPKIGSTVAINPSTKLTKCDSSFEDGILLCVGIEEIYGLVVKHLPSYDWNYDRVEVLIGDQMFWIHRSPAMGFPNSIPFFNVRELPNDGFTE
mgnify:CR=1 FL=1